MPTSAPRTGTAATVTFGVSWGDLICGYIRVGMDMLHPALGPLLDPIPVLEKGMAWLASESVVWRASAVVPDPKSLDPEAFQVGIV